MPAEIPNELAMALARETERIYSAAVTEMLERVARRLARGIDAEGWAEIKAAEVGRLGAEATRALEQLEGRVNESVAAAVTEAYAAGEAATEVELGGAFGKSSGRSLQNLLRETQQNLTATHSAILRTTMDRYRGVIAESTTRMAIGTETRREATARALAQFAREGVTGFVDTAGRRWELSTYAEMALRTASGRAAVAGSLDRMTDRGLDFVIVSNAPEECEICRPWEGKILTISGPGGGTTPDGKRVKGTVAQAREAGLLHSNCRHNLSAYVPGLTKVPTNTADPEGDKLRQRQRALERQVRASKRQTATLESYVAELKKQPGGADPKSLAALRRAKLTQAKASKRLGDFVEEHDRKRLRHRETPRR